MKKEYLVIAGICFLTIYIINRSPSLLDVLTPKAKS